MEKNTIIEKIKSNYGCGVFIVFTVFNLLYFFIIKFISNTNYNYLFLNWWASSVPYVVALILWNYYKKISNFWLAMGSSLWLLFLPNSPYMITDLIHINENSPTVLYEAMMIFSIAMQALLFGLYSLKLMEFVLSPKIGLIKTRIILFVSVLLSSFGIYLGRVLRLSSWDMFTKPIQALEMIFNHLFPVYQNPTTYSMIILFSCIQLILLYAVAEIE